MSDNKRKKCSYANKYKGIRKPICGCDYCESIWRRNNPSAFDKAGIE